MGRAKWSIPEPFGPNGWQMTSQFAEDEGSIIVSCAPHPVTEEEWIHASIAFAHRMPAYDELALLHYAVWKGRGYSYQVFAPDVKHVNIHANALHLWGKLSGAPSLPDFGYLGSI